MSPYWGREAIQPFLDYANKGILVLCKTPNPASGELQNLQVNDYKLYQIVAQKTTLE